MTARGLTLARRGAMGVSAGGGGAFNPLTQVTALHAVWAGDTAWTNPGDGNPVSSWRNHSGGGDPANTLTARPTFRAATAAFNNKPTVEFVGASSQYLDVNITTIAQPFKLLVVCNGALLTSQVVVGRGAANTAHGLGFTGTSAYRLNYATAISGGVFDGNAHVIRATADGASSQVWVDEASVVTGQVGANDHARFLLGAGFNGTATYGTFLTGHIAFCGIYDGATTDASLTTLANDLQTHYGTP